MSPGEFAEILEWFKLRNELEEEDRKKAEREAKQSTQHPTRLRGR